MAWSTTVTMDGTPKSVNLSNVHKEVFINFEADGAGTLVVKYRPVGGLTWITPVANTIEAGAGGRLTGGAIVLELSGATSGDVIVSSDEKAS